MNQVAGPILALRTPEARRGAAVRRAIALARAWTPEARPALAWETPRVVDRHGLDRIPGHRTTPIVAAIVAAGGAKMPHFSLRSGTGNWSSADAMATLTGVGLDRATAVNVASRVGTCIAHADTAGVATNVPWSPTADDARLVASALSRRVVAGVGSLLVNVRCLRAVTDELRRAPLMFVDDAPTAALAEPQDKH